jgi:S1-C subfamily serine protease
MSSSSSCKFALLFLLCWPELGVAQNTSALVERGKRATALVEVSGIEGDATGSAFCVEKSGLFITNAHVVTGRDGKVGRVWLVVECGLATQRILPAKVLRPDDENDLVLLQVNAGSDLTALELGQDAGLVELAEVTIFGYPFGRMPADRRARYPDITILPSRITGLRRDKGGLAAIQFDSQLNPGTSGGPVLDGSGKVVAVARATVRGAPSNLAIPVGRIAEFMNAPGLVFEPPPVEYVSRTRPVTWTIQVQPPTPGGRLPEGASIRVTVVSNGGKPRIYAAEPVGDGLFTVMVIPDQEIYLSIWNTSTKQYRGSGRIPDEEVKVGGKTFRLSALDSLFGGPSPRVRTRKGKEVRGAILGLGQPARASANRPITIDLKQPVEVRIHQQPTSIGLLPTPSIEAVAEVSQGTKVLARLRRRIALTVTPATDAPEAVSPTDIPPPATRIHCALVNEGSLKRIQ